MVFLNYGTFYPTNSFWHRRDPRIKLMIVILGAMIIIYDNYLGWQLFFLFLNFILFIQARLSFKRAGKTVYSFRWLLILTFLANLFTTGGSILQAVIGSLIYSFRLINLLLISSWLLATTEPLTIIKGFELIFHPLRRWIPIGDLAMILGLSFGFFPLLIEESREIAMAQRARGVSFEGKWWRRLSGLLAMVIPLFITSFRRSLEVAQAMEARGYVPGKERGSLYELKWDYGDTGSLVIILLSVLIWVVIHVGYRSPT